MRGGHCAAATAAPGAPRPRPGLCQHLHAFCLPEGPLWSSHDLRSSFCTFPSADSHAVVFFLILVATPASYSPQSNLPPPQFTTQSKHRTLMDTAVLSPCNSSQGPQLSAAHQVYVFCVTGCFLGIQGLPSEGINFINRQPTSAHVCAYSCVWGKNTTGNFLSLKTHLCESSGNDVNNDFICPQLRYRLTVQPVNTSPCPLSSPPSAIS